MPDAIAEYVALEQELLTRRLRRLLAGIPVAEEDPEEDRVEREFERLWDAMTTDDHQRLEVARRLRRRAPASTPTDGLAIHPWDWGGHPDGGYVIRTRALPAGIELSIPETTPAWLRRPGAHITRMVLDAAGLERFGPGARGVLVDSALALLGRSLDDARSQGGLRFVDPDTGEELLAIAGVPSGVAEPPAPPVA